MKKIIESSDVDLTAERIIALHIELRSLLKKSLQNAIEIGRLLIEKKRELKHGEFEAWIKENLPITKMTAYKYRQFYHNRKLLKRKKVKLLNEAYRIIQEDKNQKDDLAADRKELNGNDEPDNIDEDEFFLDVTNRLIRKIGDHAQVLTEELKLLKNEFKGWSVEQIKSFEHSIVATRQLKELRGLLTKFTKKPKGIAHSKKIKSKVVDK